MDRWVSSLHRKACKKLREIEVLEERRSNGEALNQRQIEKIDRREYWSGVKAEQEEAVAAGQEEPVAAEDGHADRSTADDAIDSELFEFRDTMRALVRGIGNPLHAAYEVDHLKKQRDELLGTWNAKLETRTGLIKFFNDEDHYGFIEGSPDVFFHAGDLRDPHGISQGSAVRFKYIPSCGDGYNDRPWATDIVPDDTLPEFTGQILSFCPSRRYGFIEYKSGRSRKTVFMHAGQLEFELCAVWKKQPVFKVVFQLARRGDDTVALRVRSAT